MFGTGFFILCSVYYILYVLYLNKEKKIEGMHKISSIEALSFLLKKANMNEL